jgi:hypothetical protein
LGIRAQQILIAQRKLPISCCYFVSISFIRLTCAYLVCRCVDDLFYTKYIISHYCGYTGTYEYECAMVPDGFACFASIHCTSGICCGSGGGSALCQSTTACVISEQCVDDTGCLSGYCNNITALCELSPSGHICSIGSQCQSGLCSGTCQVLSIGSPCVHGYECGSEICCGQSSLVCSASTCPEDDLCVTGSDCTSTYCNTTATIATCTLIPDGVTCPSSSLCATSDYCCGTSAAGISSS